MSVKNHIYHQQDFSHQDLQQHVYEGCQFINCCFDRSDLRDAKFIEAQALEGCSLQYANLKGASFENCMLAMNQFVWAECFGIEFRHCDLKGANFQRANFVNRISHSAYFCSAYITDCNLTYANFERTLLEKCELFENRWRGADLFGASMQGADLSRGEFSKELWGTFNLENADLTHVDLEGLDMRRVSLHGVKICDWQQEQLLSPFGLIVLG